MAEARRDRQAVLMLLTSAAVLALGLGAGIVAKIAAPSLDPTTLRVAGRPSTGTVSVLIDWTDPPTPAQQRRLDGLLNELILDDLRDNDLLTVWQLGSSDEGFLRRVFDRYSPARDANPLWSNPDRVAARSDSLFRMPLLRAVHALGSARGSDRSAILSAVRELTEQAEFSTGGRRREVVLVSDLFENSSIANFYRARPDFAQLRASPGYQGLRADLRGATVQVAYLARPSETPAAAEELRQFWKAYFADCGAAAVRFERL